MRPPDHYGKVITLDDWATIRHRYANQKISKRELARQAGVSCGTVDRAPAAERAPRCERAPGGSSFDTYESRVRSLRAKTPTMAATVLAELVEWPGESSLVRSKVAELRPEYARPILPIGSNTSPEQPSSAICGSRTRASRLATASRTSPRCW